MTDIDRPPYLVLVQTPNESERTQLEHPKIQYHFIDDSPLLALPKSDSENVILLDYIPGQLPTARSISSSTIATGVSISPALDDGSLNDNMYTIETSSNKQWLDIFSCSPIILNLGPSSVTTQPQTVQNILDQFKQRNAVLRAALNYPTTINPTTYMYSKHVA